MASAEVVYEAVVMSLEEHAKHPQYTERLHSLLNTFISSAFITGVPTRVVLCWGYQNAQFIPYMRM